MVSRRSAYIFSHQAYVKIILHAAKHPHKPVNGVLLGSLTGQNVLVSDAIPLLHLWTSLSPMMEIGLDLAKTHAESQGVQIVGYYQATERIDDHALAPVGERVASKTREGFPNAIAFVVDGEKIGSGEPALLPYLPSGAAWRAQTPAFSAGSLFALENPSSPARALKLIQDDGLHRHFGDFDDHLEDVTVDWLKNASCVDKI